MENKATENNLMYNLMAEEIGNKYTASQARSHARNVLVKLLFSDNSLLIQGLLLLIQSKIVIYCRLNYIIR